jgi:hypothetical protein
MRRYLVCYYTEKDDVCCDLEKIVEAVDIEKALEIFKSKTRIYKRITCVTELPNEEVFIPPPLMKDKNGRIS